MQDLFIIYLTGMAGIWKAALMGIVLKTSASSLFLMTFLGASTTVMAIYLSYDKINQFVSKKIKSDKLIRRKRRIDKLISKFGVAGLGLMGTLTMGPNITLLIGLMVVNEKTKLLVWIVLGILLWTSILTLAFIISSDLLERILFFTSFFR